MPSESGPLAVRAQLADLLDAVERDDRLAAEIERAKREFFGAGAPPHVHPSAREQSAIRFAEWYLCERVSDVLGEIPTDVASSRLGVDADLLRESVVGVFLVQSSKTDPVVRDIVHGEALELRQVPDAIDVGDVLIGRLFASPDGSGAYVPSAAMSIVNASPHFATTYKREVEALGLERRLTQAEVEHLLFREQAEEGEPAPPLEHVEAELGRLLEGADKPDLRPTDISDALRLSAQPSQVIESLLEELAFDTKVDLEEARRLLLTLATSVAQLDAPIEDDGATPDKDPTPKITPPKLRGRAPDFHAKPGETLGEQLARRIEEGLAGAEDVESLFANVENLLGESIDDDEDGAEGAFDDGDLEPLVREFEWELDLAEPDRDRMQRFLDVQREAPVPRSTLESIESDDVLRFLLHPWLDAPPTTRVDEVRARYAVLERFYAWAADTQDIDRRDELRVTHEEFVAQLDRLQRAALSLSSDTSPRRAIRLSVVVEVHADSARLQLTDSDESMVVPLRSEGSVDLEVEDVVMGELDRESSSVAGMAIVIPGILQHLLG